MNPFGSVALPVKWMWRLVLLYAFIAPGEARLWAAPHKSAPKASASPAVEPGPVAVQDDLQSTTAKDLLLTPENEKKADALSDFIQGALAEDNGDVDGSLDAYRKVLAVDPVAKIRAEEGSETLMLLSAKVALELAQGGDTAAGIDLLKDTIKIAPKDAMGYFFLSQLYQQFLKKYDVALKYAQQALELDPNNFSFYVANYELELNLGQPEKAGEILERASKAQSDDPQFWLDLSELYVRAETKDNRPVPPDDLKKMNAIFDKTVALAKDKPLYLARVADFEVLTRQVKQAIPLYRKALEMKGDPADPALLDARHKLAISLIATGQRDEAIKELENLVKIDPVNSGAYESLGELYADKQDYDHALDSYQQFLQLNSGDPRHYAPVLDMMLRLKKYDQAVDLMRDAHRKFPDIPRVTYHLAVALSAAKKNEEAMAAFQQAEVDAQNSDTESDMLDGEFYKNYALAAEQSGLTSRASDLFNKALAAYQQLLQLNPAEPQNYQPAMEMMLRLKKFDQAVDLMSEAHRKFPNLPRVTYNLALVLSAAKKNQEAMTAFQEAEAAAQHSDSDRDMLNGEFYYYYGSAAGEAGLIPKATELLQQAISLDPQGKTLQSPGSAYNDLGYLWVDHDQKIEEGGDYIKHALEMEPGNAAYIDSLGWYYFKKGDLDKALDQLLKAAAGTKPEDAEVDDHIAETYQKLGKPAEALNYWQKAIAIDPGNKDIAKKIEAAKQKTGVQSNAAPAH